jgi:hypothetical protein
MSSVEKAIAAANPRTTKPQPAEIDAALQRVLARCVEPACGDPPASRHIRPPGTPRRLILTGLAAVAAAAAVCVTLVVPGSNPARPAAVTARELAYRAAAAAAAQPAVPAGQWVYWHETTVAGYLGAPPPWPHMKPTRTTDQVWTTADSDKAAFIVHGHVRYVCPSQLIPAPCPTIIGQPLPTVLTEGGGQADINPIPVSYAKLTSLPVNPLALDRYFGSLHGHGGSAAFSEFQIIYDLVVSYVMPPALTAELYRALGDVPGITVNDHAVDAAGRTGIGFQSPVPVIPPHQAGAFPIYPVDQLILDPSTYELMGYVMGYSVAHDPSGSRLSWHTAGISTAVLKSSLVSGPGVVP